MGRLFLLLEQLVQLQADGLHRLKADVEHLGEGSLGRGAVDQIARRQMNVVARAHGKHEGMLVNLARGRSHRGQQCLDHL